MQVDIDIRCPFCERTFVRNLNLSVHLKKVHGTTYKKFLLERDHAGVWSVCACGCGTPVRYFNGRFCGRVRGHEATGRRDTDEQRAQKSKSMLKFIEGHPEKREHASQVMKKRWKDDRPGMNAIREKNMAKLLDNPEKKRAWSEKISETTAQNYVDGKIRWKTERIMTTKGGEMFCRSSWEKRHALALDADATVSKFSYEPLSVTYVDATGKKRRYVPDFVVLRVDGSVEMHEVGVEHLKMTRPQNIVKLDAARSYCEENDIEFRLVSFS